MGRNQYIDFLKGISIFGVFMIHITALTISEEHVTITALFIDSLFRFAVPFFFGILGYMTFVRYQRITDWKGFYKNKALLIVIPYLLWSFLYFFVPTVYPFLDEGMGKENGWDILLGYSEIHLYFMIPYTTFLLLTPLVIKFVSKIDSKIVSKVLVFITAAFVFLLVMAENKLTAGKVSYFHETDYLLILHWIGYYCVGLYIAINQDNIEVIFGKGQKKKTWKLFVTILVYVIAVGIFTILAKVLTPYATPHLVLNAFIALLMLAMIYQRAKDTKIVHWIKKLGQQTFPFYLSHVLFIKIGFILFCSKDVTVWNLFLVATFAFALSIGYVYVHGRLVQVIRKNRDLIENEKSYIRFSRRGEDKENEK